jgi:leucyl-tRNA synthetase
VSKTLWTISEFVSNLRLSLNISRSRELSTTDDNYVKWTQWIFLQLFKAGLAAQTEVPVNWCAALGSIISGILFFLSLLKFSTCNYLS